MKRQLSTADSHLLRIARDNFRHPAKAKFLGGPTPTQSREIITRLTGRDPGPVVEDPRLPGYHRERQRPVESIWYVYGKRGDAPHRSLTFLGAQQAGSVADAKRRILRAAPKGSRVEYVLTRDQLEDFHARLGAHRTRDRAARRRGVR